jgi:hypothetical protein
MIITNRAHPTELAEKFASLLPPYQWGKYVPTTDFDGYEGAYEFLIDAIFRHRGRVIVADVDFFIHDWFGCFKTAVNNADIIVSEASIPHRVAMPKHIGNPFFWVFDADRARAAIAKSGLTSESLRTFGASDILFGEPFWGLYDFLYGTAALPFQTLEVSTHADGISTVTDFGIHTWYARDYNQDKFHTKRINKHYQWALSNKSTL